MDRVNEKCEESKYHFGLLKYFTPDFEIAIFGRLPSHIASQNVDFAEAEAEADVATAVAAHHDTLLRNVRPFAPGAKVGLSSDHHGKLKGFTV